MPEHPGPDLYLDCGGFVSGPAGGLEEEKSIPGRLCLEMGVVLSISCLPYLSMEKVFQPG